MSSQPNTHPSPSQSRRALLAGLALSPVLASSAKADPMTTGTLQTAATSVRRPIVVFDVNETLLDFNVLAPVFERVFGDRRMLREWFNQVILYSEALTLAGDYADSGTVGVAVLNMLAEIRGRTAEPSDVAELKRLSGAMPTYPDTPEALAKLKEAGFGLVTLSNNPTAGLGTQLTHAGLRRYFDQLHSIDDRVHRYKPARESYTSLASELGVAPTDLWLVSCHAFDALGAASVGYRTALILRPENAPVALGKRPEVIETDLRVLADRVVEMSPGARHG